MNSDDDVRQKTGSTHGMSESTMERSPFNAKPLSASEYISLLESRPELVLRVSDGTGDGTFRFWTENGDLYWRCLNWFGAKSCPKSHLSAVLDGEDATTQLLIERPVQPDGDRAE